MILSDGVPQFDQKLQKISSIRTERRQDTNYRLYKMSGIGCVEVYREISACGDGL